MLFEHLYRFAALVVSLVRVFVLVPRFEPRGQLRLDNAFGTCPVHLQEVLPLSVKVFPASGTKFQLYPAAPRESFSTPKVSAF